MRPHGHIAAADCERCRPGPVAQPVNTVSSLAFCAAGAVVITRARAASVETPRSAEEALGWSAIAAGLGSVAYHGPGTRAGQVAHDASLITMLGTVVLADVAPSTGRRATRSTLGTLAVGATVAALSRRSTSIQILAGVAATAAEIARVTRRTAPRHETRRTGSPRATVEWVVASVGATGHVLGRTGGPLCRPDARLQAHALWHLAMATVLVLRDVPDVGVGVTERARKHSATVVADQQVQPT